MTHRLWTVHDVVLHVVRLSNVGDVFRLLMTCSSFYGLCDMRALWLVLLDAERSHRDLGRAVLGSFVDSALPDLKVLLQRLIQAKFAWKSTTSTPSRIWTCTLEPGDYIDLAVPGTSALLVRNPQMCTLRCVDTLTGAQSLAVPLESYVIHRLNVLSLRTEHRVVYWMSTIDDMYTPKDCVIRVMSIHPAAGVPRIEEVFHHVVPEDRYICRAGIFSDGEIVGYIAKIFADDSLFSSYVVVMVVFDISSGTYLMHALSLPEAQIMGLSDVCVVDKQLCLTLITRPIDDSSTDDYYQKTMCYAPAGALLYGPSLGLMNVAAKLELSPIAFWQPSDFMRPEDSLVDTAHSCVGCMGMTFEFWLRWIGDATSHGVFSATYEPIYDVYSDAPMEFRARASPHYLELPNVQCHDRVEREMTLPTYAWHGATLALPVFSAVHEIDRVCAEHARNVLDFGADALVGRDLQASGLFGPNELDWSSSWGKLKIVQFSPTAEPHVCDLATWPYAGAVEAVALDVAFATIYVQGDTADEENPEIYCLSYA